MDQPSPSKWKKQTKKMVGVGEAGKGKLRSIPRRFQKWSRGLKKPKTTKTSKNDTPPTVESDPAKDPLPSLQEAQRPISSPSADPSIEHASFETTRATLSSATSFQTQEPTKLAAKGIEETLERPTTPSKISSWPLVSKDIRNDQDNEKKKSQEAKENIFVSHISDKVNPIENGIGHKEERSEKRIPGRAVGDHKQSLSTVVTSNTVAKEDLKKRYSPAAMTRSLQLAARIQKMRSGAPKDSAKFVKVWEQELLPELTQILDQYGVENYSINVRRGKEPGHRIIDVMTEGNAGEKVSSLLESRRDAIFPEDLSRIHFEFRGGKRGPCTSETASHTLQTSARQALPMNYHRYSFPVMGDSVGSTSLGTSGSATLGPIIKIAESFYRLLNWHTFDDERGGLYRNWKGPVPPELNAVHPSPDDLAKYAPHSTHVSIGNTVAYSGNMYNTSRLSTSLKPDSVQVVTDWVLCKTETTNSPNKVRFIMLEGRTDSFSHDITGIAEPRTGGPLVYSTGRSSGHSFGSICEVLGFNKQNNGTVTRDYAIESTAHQDVDWNLGGMGVLGDSGAGVIDMKSHKLLGQLWGRNKYDGNPEEPRVTYFTAMSDIYDDIQERFPWTGRCPCPRPTLPGEVLPSDRAGSPAKELLNSTKEDAKSASFFATTTNGHLAHSAARRSCAQSTIVSNDDGNLVLKHWVVFPHAKTWPLALSAAS